MLLCISPPEIGQKPNLEHQRGKISMQHKAPRCFLQTACASSLPSSTQVFRNTAPGNNKGPAKHKKSPKLFMDVHATLK